MRNIEKEQRERQERINELQKCIKNKEESVQNRIERTKRNQEIAESAANENKDSSEVQLRENLYVQKLWNSFMKKKMEKEMRESATIDEAFKAIKTATGVTDVQEMVKKFLTKEQTYSHLLVNVSESERKIDKLKKDNDELRSRLLELKIDSEANAGTEDMDLLDKFSDEDIMQMKTDITQQKKDYAKLQEKYKKINLVNDQISGWARRVHGKFSALTEEPIFKQEPVNIVKIFAAMELITTTELRTLKERAEENPIEPEEPFHDFATEDFINKNIRVRPISGITHDETKDGRVSNISKGGVNDETEEAHENFNKLAIFEIEDQRRQVKAKIAAYQEELRKKQALEEKKAQKK